MLQSNTDQQVIVKWKETIYCCQNLQCYTLEMIFFIRKRKRMIADGKLNGDKHCPVLEKNLL